MMMIPQDVRHRKAFAGTKRFGRKALVIGRLRAEADAFFFAIEVAALRYPAQCSGFIFLA